MLPHSEILFWFSPSYHEEEYTNKTFLNMVAHECSDGMLSDEPLQLYDYTEDEEKNSVMAGVLLRGDIMWSTGNLTKPNILSPTKPCIDIEKELEGQIFVPPKAYFNCLSPVPEGANLVNNNSLHMTAVSYTPDYDHSYNKPKSEEKKFEPVKEEMEEEEDDDEEEESESDDSSGDDDVDIETVSDDGQKVCAIKLQRTMRPIMKPKRFSQRENVPPLKLKATFNKQGTTRVVAAMLKRTKQFQSNGKTVIRTKRSRRPANSLPCSPGSSRSNSDTEEPVVRRSMHNNMERMRRNQQRMALHCLRDKIPELRHNPKVSKVKIINKAKDYITALHVQEQEQEELLRRLRDKNSLLRKKLELYKLKH